MRDLFRMTRPAWTFTGERLRHRTEPAPAGGDGGDGGTGGAPAGGAAGDGGQGGGEPAGGGEGGTGGSGGGSGGSDKQPTNADMAKIRREATAAQKRADDAERKLKEAEDAKLDEKQRAEKERDEAKAAATASDERATKAEVRSRLVLRVGAKTAAGQAAVDLSEAKLLELKDASDEELDAHLDAIVERYSLPAPASGTGAPQPFGAPAGGSSGGGGSPPPAAGGGQGASGEPVKDYRAGIGRGLFGLARRAGAVGEPGQED